MDAFYASIEQRDHPELRGRPVIVGANSPRGVVAAASYEARVFGVHSAMPGFRARELCPHAAFVGSSMETYGAVSDQVHAVFAEVTPEIEPLALDEAFLDVTGSVGLFGGPLAVAKYVKRRVREVTALPVSVAVAPNKLVAKIACSFSKPDGLLLVPVEAVRWLLDPLPVRKLWGVGPVLGRRLQEAGYHRFVDLRTAAPERLREAVGDRAEELRRLASGIDDRPVVAHREPRSVGEENTFEHDVQERGVVTAALTSHAESVARRLRRLGYRGRTITLRVKLGQRRGRRVGRDGHEEPVYPLLTRSKTMHEATDDGAMIRSVAVGLWDEARIAEAVRLVGISVSGLERRDARQLDLFSERAKSDALGTALDAIRERFGRESIRRAVGEPEKITHSNRRKRGD